jgi:aldehyde:ferredoxin oxidoreductase
MSQLGSVEFIESLVRMIALRQGFGDALAGGLRQAASALGGQSASLIKHPDPYEPRMYLTTALLWALEPREPIQALHEVGYPLAQWTTGIKGTDKTHVDSAAVRAIAKRFWGSEAAADMTTTDGKALAAKRIQDRQYAKESLIVCDWIYPISDSEHSHDHVGDPTLESQFFSAVTGIETDEAGLYRMGEAVFNQQRAALIRDGWRGREGDRLPDDWHNEPLKRGVMDPDCLVPDKNGKPVSRVGAVVDRQEFERMKDEYYQIRGWDVATGLPTRRTLEGLGLKDVADDLQRRGLLGQGT